MLPFFLPCEGGQRFCLYHPANGLTRGAIIYLHPFAEEMNKSRRMAAIQARAMAAAGFSVLQIDLLGCGDSSGDFSDASWQAWQDDVLLAYRWLRTKTDAALTLWGLRAGCLLAATVAVNLPEPTNFILWQPVISGNLHWQQFMRLKMAGELASGQAKGVTAQLKQRLASGQSVEIVGYEVVPELAGGIEASELLPPSLSNSPITAQPDILQISEAKKPAVAWFELSTRENATLAPASQKRIEQWQSCGYRVQAETIQGPAFWQTTEIEDAPELIVATMAALEAFQ